MILEEGKLYQTKTGLCGIVVAGHGQTVNLSVGTILLFLREGNNMKDFQRFAFKFVYGERLIWILVRLEDIPLVFEDFKVR